MRGSSWARSFLFCMVPSKVPIRANLMTKYNEGIVRVGEVVLECLKLAGLECQWDGDWEKRIVVLSPADMTEAAPEPELVAQELLSLFSENGSRWLTAN
jgi:hypothetical protein